MGLKNKKKEKLKFVYMTSSATLGKEKRRRYRNVGEEGREGEMREGQEDGSRVAGRSIPQGL